MFDQWLSYMWPSKLAPPPHPPPKKPESKPKTKLEEVLAKYDEYPAKERLLISVSLGCVTGSLVTIGAVKFWSRFLRRYPTHEWITPDLYAKQRWIKGIVTSVGDPDGLRLYHTPVCARLWKFLGIGPGAKGLTNQTISIRLAGIDAPEYGHFSKEAQPFSQEALDLLKELVLGKVVYCQLLKRDQYARAVAAVMLPSWLARFFLTPNFGKSIADEMLRAGLAVTYIDSGAVYGRGGLKGHLAIEAEAKKKKRGQWVKGTKIETPSQYKKRIRATTPESEVENKDIAAAAEEAGDGKGGLRGFFSKSRS